MKNYRLVKTWPILVFSAAALCSCASLSEQVVLWSRQGQIESAQTRSAELGLLIGNEAYQASLKRWPFISDAGLQRRALLYSLLKSQNASLNDWHNLSEQEDLNLELAQIAGLRRRNAF